MTIKEAQCSFTELQLYNNHAGKNIKSEINITVQKTKMSND